MIATRLPIVRLAAAGVLSVATATIAAGAGQPLVTAIAATAFCVLLVMAGWMLKDIRNDAANAGLFAFAYAWGGISLLSIYSFSGVWWQHGRQYGVGMLVIALALAAYAYWGARNGGEGGGSHPRAQIAVAIQAVAALGGLAFMALVGKFASIKGDWPANQIFLLGGLAIVALSAIMLIRRS